MGSAASLASGSSSDPERSLVCARFSSRRAPSSFSSTSSSSSSSSESRREMRVEARETLPRSGNMSSAAAASTAARPTSSYSRFSASAGGSFPLLKLLLSERSRRSAVVRAHWKTRSLQLTRTVRRGPSPASRYSSPGKQSDGMANDVAIKREGGGTAEFAFAELPCAGFALGRRTLPSRASSQKGLLLTSRLPPEVPTWRLGGASARPSSGGAASIPSKHPRPPSRPPSWWSCAARR
mmetsp:Transcript_12044/g.38316  ORF Transcript_12044/g.38316 Transcript_12044/m.38316 type:complete len:238 (-) Transcript_12044:882-1595(-)